MNILFISTVFTPAIGFGGPVTNTIELAKNITKKNHNILVLTSNAFDFNNNMKINQKKISEYLKVVYFKNWCRVLESFITPGMIIGLIKERNHYDIIHIHTFRQFQDVICYFMSFFLKKPYVMTMHGLIKPRNRGIIIKKIFDFIIGNAILKKSSMIISTSKLQTRELNEMAVNKEKIYEIPFGVNKFVKKNGFLKNKLGLEKNSKIILFIGRIHVEKGLITLINAFEKIENEKIHLVIAGPDYGFKNELEKAISKLLNKSRIHLIGVVNEEERDQILSESTLLIQPSEYESFGMTSLEGAAAGLPIIISDSCGLADEFNEHNAGIVFKTNNILELTNKINHILNDHDLQKTLSLNAKKFASRFNWEKIAESHIKMYNHVLTNRNKMRTG